MTSRLALILTLASASAFGQEAEFYVGAGGGGSNFETGSIDIALPTDPAQTISAVVDDSDGNFRLYGGYRLKPHFSVEAVYSDIGEFEIIDAANSFSATFDARSIDLAAVGLLPLADGRFDLFARAGLAFWDVDAEAANLNDQPGQPTFVSRPASSGQDLFWSLGFNINGLDDKRWTFRSELTTYEIGEFEKVEQLAFSVQYRF